jgi:hypothetical protein
MTSQHSPQFAVAVLRKQRRPPETWKNFDEKEFGWT